MSRDDTVIRELIGLPSLKSKITEELALERYLKCEQLLAMFFRVQKFCLNSCIGLEESLYSTTQKKYPGYIGCCVKNYHDINVTGEDITNELLLQQRTELFGEPKEKEYCGYHDINQGCALSTHKTPACISYVCGTRREELLYSFNIDFNVEPVRKMLIAVVNGSISDKKYNNLKLNICTAIQRLNWCKYHPSMKPEMKIIDLTSF